MTELLRPLANVCKLTFGPPCIVKFRKVFSEICHFSKSITIRINICHNFVINYIRTCKFTTATKTRAELDSSKQIFYEYHRSPVKLELGRNIKIILSNGYDNQKIGISNQSAVSTAVAITHYSYNYHTISIY